MKFTELLCDGNENEQEDKSHVTSFPVRTLPLSAQSPDLPEYWFLLL